MPLKGTLSSGSTVEVTFSPNFSNVGTSSILTFYIPNPAAPPQDPTQFTTVAPGVPATHVHDPLASAFQFRVQVDVPDTVGGGQLEVKENGTVKDSEPISADTLWGYIVT